MCYLCKEEPCQIGCPHWYDSSFESCVECGSTIHYGQEFYDLNGCKIHKECVSVLTSTDILKALKIEPQVNGGKPWI